MKILYNVTIKVETEIHEQWLDWMKKVHIPSMMATECFESYRVTKIIGDDDEHGVGFAIQYVSPSMVVFTGYQENFAKLLQQEHSQKYGNRYVAFRTLMEICDEG